MPHDNSNEQPESEASARRPPRVEHPLDASHPTGRTAARPAAPGPAESHDSRASRRAAAPDEHPISGGSRPRIPGQRVTDPSDQLIAAFQAGDPEKAYEAALELRNAYHEAMSDAARLRFKLNFGTPTCDNCQGLVAGPQVAATCFQVRRCNYTNVKIGEAEPHQLRIIDKISAK